MIARTKRATKTDRATAFIEDYFDALLGVRYRFDLSERWGLLTRGDLSFGDSEGTWNAKTTLNWKPFEHWVFNFSLRYEAIEYNEEEDVRDGDYYYDADETTIGAGFVYVW